MLFWVGNLIGFDLFCLFQSKGLSNLPRFVLFTSEDSHYSVQKLASFMGLGSDNVYQIQVDDRGKLNVQHLEQEIQRARNEGAVPFMVSATAGTTVLGAFDPLEGIADLCQKYGLWMHVDAAWGGGALMSQKYRKLLKGIERFANIAISMCLIILESSLTFICNNTNNPH